MCFVLHFLVSEKGGYSDPMHSRLLKGLAYIYKLTFSAYSASSPLNDIQQACTAVKVWTGTNKAG